MSSEEKIKKLSGYSGCSIFFIKKDNKFFVRKYSSDLSYNQRLIKQAEKQKEYLNVGNIKTPRVLGYGYENGLYYFDMEYIRGRTLAECFDSIPLQNVVEIINQIIFKHNTLILATQVEVENYYKKIEELKLKVNNSFQLNEEFDLLQTMDESSFYISNCHGDLTLENIIVTENNEVYLIDFLDSFVESWQIDVAKLLQDFYVGWSFRFSEENENIKIRQKIMTERIDNKLFQYGRGGKIYRNVYLLLLMNLIRILPYVRDLETCSYIYKALAKVRNKIKEVI